jgi:hypothetical protein
LVSDDKTGRKSTAYKPKGKIDGEKYRLQIIMQNFEREPCEAGLIF